MVRAAFPVPVAVDNRGWAFRPNPADLVNPVAFLPNPAGLVNPAWADLSPVAVDDPVAVVDPAAAVDPAGWGNHQAG